MAHHKLLYLIAFILAGCTAGTGEGLNSNGQPFQAGDDAPLSAEFKSIQDNVLTPVCTVCHSGASAPVGLQLDEANSYSMLVGVESVQVAGTLRVDPGNPDASYIIAKIEGSATVGGQMPLGGPALPQATIDLIRQWISEGALPPAIAPPPVNQPPTVVSTTPSDGQTLTALPKNINSVFSHDIDASTVTVGTVVLQRSGGDGTFADGNEIAIIPASVGLSSVNATLVTMDLTGVASTDDTYQLILVGSGATPLMDLNANALDGDNDTVAGGDFQATFTVTSPGATLEATWRSIQDIVFTPICTACHIDNGAPENLQLNEVNSYAMLVNISSTQEPAFMRVAPGDPDNSYLIQKLEGTAASGSRMPQGGPFLSQPVINLIRQWISDGAAKDGSPGGPPAVAVLAPTLTVQASVVSGDEFPVSVSIENTGVDIANSATVTLGWAPADNLILRDGLVSQPLPALNPGESTSVSWLMRGRAAGAASINVTVTESNGAFTQVSSNITVTE